MSSPGRPAAPKPPHPLGSCAPHEAAGAADAHVPGGAAGAGDAPGGSRGAQLPCVPSPLDKLSGLSVSPGDGPLPQSGPVAADTSAAASTPPRPPPHRPPTAEELAELDDVNFRRCVVASESRYALHSLVVAWLRWSQANAYVFQSQAEGGSDVLYKRAWVTLRSLVWPILLDRIVKGTLLPCCCRDDEVVFHVHGMQANQRAKEEPELGAASLLPYAVCFGYEVALYAADLTLALLPLTLWSPADRKSGQDFVLAVLRLIPQTAAVQCPLSAEAAAVTRIEKDMTPQKFGAQFCAAVLALWRSAAVAGVLRSRGTLKGGVAAHAAIAAAYEARKQKVVALLGLKPCGLPSCGKKEASVSHFKNCSRCLAVKYCCHEHVLAHWPAHQTQCDALGRARCEREQGGGGDPAA